MKKEYRTTWSGKPCRHCQKGKGNLSRRWLCRRCWKNPEIKDLYKPAESFRSEFGDHDPTMEELEAMISEQMKCLPAWWDDDVQKQRNLNPIPLIRIMEVRLSQRMRKKEAS